MEIVLPVGKRPGRIKQEVMMRGMDILGLSIAFACSKARAEIEPWDTRAEK
jgi:hypothetical protein